jgi:hypothetical protein
MVTRIAVLSHDPDEAVQWLSDADVIRMPIEITQVLLTIWHKVKPGTFNKMIEYLEGDPWLEWAIRSSDNYTFLWNLGMDLIDEHAFRFGDRAPVPYKHGSFRTMERLGAIPPIPEQGADPLPIQPDQARLGYHPQGFFKTYTHRDPPPWLE